MSDRFDDLVGEIEDPEERARLRRVHTLLLSVDPPPKVSSALEAPPRPAGRAPAAPAAHGSRSDRGCACGGRLRRRLVRERSQRRCRSRGVDPDGRDGTGGGRHGVDRRAAAGRGGQLADERRRPRAHAEPGPLGLLRALADQGWKARRPVWPLHREHRRTKVVLSVPYGLRKYDGWVVTRHDSDVPLLSTSQT
jgi:hypothetical protein